MAFNAQLASDYGICHLLCFIVHQHHCYESRGELKGFAHPRKPWLCFRSSALILGVEGEDYKTHAHEYCAYTYWHIYFLSIMNKIDYRISLNETNAIKGIAIIAMLVHHLFYEHPEYGEPTFQLALIGKVCVAIFLFLSGYGLSVQYSKILNIDSALTRINRGGDTLKFLYQRYIKFYLNYWIIFLISVPIGVLVFGRELTIPYGENACIPYRLALDFMGVQGMMSYNITWWFNRLILSLYLLFPLLYWGMSRKWYISLAILVALFLKPVLIIYLFHWLDNSLYIYTFAFALGMFISIYIEGIGKLLNKINPKLVLSMSVMAVIAFCIERQWGIIPRLSGISCDGFITAFTAFAIVTAARLTKYNFPILSFLGRHSMNMYMLHTFVFGYFFEEFIYSFKYPLLIFMVLFVITLTLSIIIEFAKTKCQFYALQNKVINLVK